LSNYCPSCASFFRPSHLPWDTLCPMSSLQPLASRCSRGTQRVGRYPSSTHRVPIQYPRVPLEYSRGTDRVLLPNCAWYSQRIRACAHARVCAADYGLGPANTNACRAGNSKITTEVTCRVAAGFLGKPYGGSTSYNYNPSGCYLNTSVGSVYLNTHPTGGTAANAQPLCLGTGAPFQSPPPAHRRDTPWVEYRGSGPVPH
jgi:hypothetical protein